MLLLTGKTSKAGKLWLIISVTHWNISSRKPNPWSNNMFRGKGAFLCVFVLLAHSPAAKSNHDPVLWFLNRDIRSPFKISWFFVESKMAFIPTKLPRTLEGNQFQILQILHHPYSREEAVFCLAVLKAKSSFRDLVPVAGVSFLLGRLICV